MTGGDNRQQLQLAFYGDDFTGSTDALECLSLGGLRTRLFLESPTVHQLTELGSFDAIGVAGRTRSLPTEQIEAELRPKLEILRSLAPRHVHYKVCSTFDSSPTVGSIGQVIDLGMEIFGGPFVPLVVASPPLGRWCVFGNLFARFGIGSDGEIFRLDRHPAMRHHPSTPADESDLRLHLSRQTDRRIELIDVLQLNGSQEARTAELRQQIAAGGSIILFDALERHHLTRIGQLIDAYVTPDRPLFSVGSSAIETGLTDVWSDRSGDTASATWHWPEIDGPVLVLSGSCSPVTSGQISSAVANGFQQVALDTPVLFGDPRRSAMLAATTEQLARHLEAGDHVIVHTCLGNDDRRKQLVSAVHERMATNKLSPSEIIGKALGELAHTCIERGLVGVTCIAGGDTSSYAGRELGIDSLQFAAPFVTGAPLCRIDSTNPRLSGHCILFKGGQVGSPDFFNRLASRSTPSRQS